MFADVLPKLFRRGSGSLPTTAASAASGCTGLLRAFLGAAAFFGVGIGQLERAGLGCQAKNQPCFSGSRERLGESQPIVLGLFIRKLISFDNTHDPTSQVFLNLGLENLGEARMGQRSTISRPRSVVSRSQSDDTRM